MTVTKTTSVATYVGNGVDTTFEFDFYVANKESMEVWVSNPDNGDELEIIDSSLWSISGLLDEEGGVVTFNTPPTNGVSIWLRRQTALQQTTELTDQTRYNASNHGRVLDKIMTAVQDLRRDGRHRPRTRYPDGTLDILFPEPAPGYYIGFDVDGNIEAKAPPPTVIPVTVSAAFESRVALVTWRGTNAPTAGHVYMAAPGLAFRGTPGSSPVSDLPDLTPIEPYRPEHWGCLGDGVSDDRAKLNTANLWLEGIGGGELIFDKKTYGVSQEVGMRSNVSWRGVPGKTTIKRIGSLDKQCLYNPYRNTAGMLYDISIYGIIFDNDHTTQVGVTASSAAGLGPVIDCRLERCVFMNSKGYGLGFQSGPGQSDTRSSEDVTILDCVFRNNGYGVGSDTYDGLDIKHVKNLLVANCKAFGNVDKGLNVRGTNLTFVGNECFENGTAGLDINASVDGSTQESSCSVLGGVYRENTGYGLVVASGTTGGVTRMDVVGAISYNNGAGGATVTNGLLARVRFLGGAFYSNDSHGIRIGEKTESVVIIGSDCSDNVGSGIYSNADETVTMIGVYAEGNDRYGFEETSGSSGNVIGSGCRFLGNTLGSCLFGSNNRPIISNDFSDFLPGAGDIIASALTITLPKGGQAFTITGSATIQTVNGGYRHRVVTLLLPPSCTVKNGTGNILMAGSADYIVSESGRTLSMVYDGSNWRQI